ncbi:MAG: hypothetical protein QOF85_27 [Solirubrobacterales bacterium]|nr:hypothetical protein [Solirubrobacterales bacterium]
MANRIDAMGHRVQAAARKPVVHRVFSKPPFHQLPSCNHPVLPLRQLRHGGVVARASPSQPAYIAG